MITISLCMIVKDEEDVLARCLQSVKGIPDEIIIVDTGSTDRTKDIAKSFTDRVYDFPWVDDFSAARNYAFSFANCDYCMWLDADDILLESDHDRLLELKGNLKDIYDPGAVDVIMMKYNVGFDKNGNPTLSYYRERILRNSDRYKWSGAIHEAISPLGHIIHSDIAVTHRKLHPSDPDRNLRIFEKQIKFGRTLSPREQFYYARELYYHERYTDAIAVLEPYLERGDGWTENRIEACRLLALCYYPLNNKTLALTSLLKSLSMDEPRAEICCDIAKHFYNDSNYSLAAYWYELALTRAPNDESGAFVSPDCYGYLPYIQLCVCYDKLGMRERAIECNKRAGEIKPDDPSYLHNLEFFKELQ